MAGENTVVVTFVGDTSSIDAANEKVMAEQQQLTQTVVQGNAKAATSTAQVTDETKKLNDSFKAIKTTIAGGNLKEATDQMSKLGNAISTTTSYGVHFRAEFIRAKNELKEMYLTGQTAGDAFDKLRAKIKLMGRAQQEANFEIENASKHFLALRAAGEAIQASAAFYETAIGATALFGDKNEELEKSMRKLLATMALVNGLTQISTALRQESALMQGLAVAKTYAYGTALKVVGAIETAFGVESETAWAIATGGLSLLVAALIAAGTYIGYMIQQTDKATEEQKKFNDALKEAIDYFTQRNELASIGADQILASIDKEIVKAKERGASAAELRNLEHKRDIERLQAAQDLYEANKKLTDQLADDKERSSALDELARKEKELATLKQSTNKFYYDSSTQTNKDRQKREDQLTAEIDNQKKLLSLGLGVLKERQEAYNNYHSNEAKRELDARQEALRDSKAYYDAQAIIAGEGTQKELQAKISSLTKERDLTLTNTQLTSGQRLEIEKKYQQDVSNLYTGYAQRVREGQKNIIAAQLAQAKEGSEEEMKLKLQLIETTAEAEMIAAKNDAQKRIAIRAKADKDGADLEKQFLVKQAEELSQTKILLEQAALNKTKENTKAAFDAQKIILQLEAQAEIDKVNNEVHSEDFKAAKILEINSKLYKDVLAVQKQADQQSANQTAQHLKDLEVIAQTARDKITDSPDSSPAQKKTANIDYDKADMKIISRQQDALKQAHADGLVSDEDYYSKKLELQKQHQDAANKLATDSKALDAKDIAKESIKIAQTTSNAIFEIENQNRQTSLNNALKKLDQQQQAELANKSLTEQQKSAIEASFAKKRAAMELQNWKANQQAKREQAIINGALAITNILATMNWATFGVAQALAIAGAVAATAAQVAVISSAKPPQFAHGTSNAPEGMALVGEEGPELVYLNQGAKVITHPETQAILDKYAVPNIQPAEMPYLSTGTHGVEIDYKKFSLAFAEVLKNNPQVRVNLDKNGYALHIIDATKRIQRRNNRYRT